MLQLGMPMSQVRLPQTHQPSAASHTARSQRSTRGTLAPSPGRGRDIWSPPHGLQRCSPLLPGSPRMDQLLEMKRFLWCLFFGGPPKFKTAHVCIECCLRELHPWPILPYSNFLWLLWFPVFLDIVKTPKRPWQPPTQPGLLSTLKKVEPRKDRRQIIRKHAHQGAMKFLSATASSRWGRKTGKPHWPRLTPTDPDWLLKMRTVLPNCDFILCTFEKSTRGVNKKTIYVFFWKDLNINSVVSFSAFRLRSKLKHFWHICQMRSSSNDPMCGW